MEMHQVRYFLAVCEEKHFTKAALRCGVTQPSLTKAIQALEAELGGPLFERSPKIELTERGRAVEPYLRQILRYVERARRQAARFNDVVMQSPARLDAHDQGQEEVETKAESQRGKMRAGRCA